MISVAQIESTSLLCDPRWVSNPLEQAERLISQARAKKVVHNFAWNLLYNKVFVHLCLEPTVSLVKQSKVLLVLKHCLVHIFGHLCLFGFTSSKKNILFHCNLRLDLKYHNTTLDISVRQESISSSNKIFVNLSNTHQYDDRLNIHHHQAKHLHIDKIAYITCKMYCICISAGNSNTIC